MAPELICLNHLDQMCVILNKLLEFSGPHILNYKMKILILSASEDYTDN